MSDKKPFNDVTEHMRNIEGYPSEVDLNKLPKPLKFFGYFFISVFGLSGLFILIRVIRAYMVQ